LELLEALDPQRWRPTVVCSGRGGLQERVAALGIPHVVIPHQAWRKGRYMVSRYLQAWRISTTARQTRYSFIHANEFHSLPHALTAARFHAWRTRTFPRPVTAHVRLSITPRQIRTYHLDKAARIIVVSRAVASLFDGYPDLSARVRVVHNGVNLDRFQLPSEADRRRAREALGVRPGEFLAGIVGLISPRKCQHIAIEALSRVRDSCPSVRLVLAGEPFGSSVAYGHTLSQTIEQNHLTDAVRLPGFRDAVQEVYAALDLNLLISSEEGFGRTIVEAGAMQVPSVGTRVGGIPELIEPGKTGELIELNDAEGLARLLKHFATQPEAARRMGEAARGHVLERFSIQAHARAMEDVWGEVLAMDRGARGA